MKTKLLLILFIATSVLRADLASVDKTLERALYAEDPALLESAQQQLDAALKENPTEPALPYYRGFAAYVDACLAYASKDKDLLEKRLVAADNLLKSVKGSPWQAEAIGLRGLIMGRLIGARGRAAGFTLGPKMMNLTAESFDAAPASGRAMTFHAVTLRSTPEAFGGDLDEALRLLERATASFEKQQNTSTGPQWGHAHALNWLAQVRMKKGDLAGAKAVAEKALAIAPDYKNVRYRVLPLIEKKIAAK